MGPSHELIQGDAADTLSSRFGGTIDMIYADPPFGNGLVWTGSAGTFSDRWSLDSQSSRGWLSLAEHSQAGSQLIGTIAVTANARGYLGMMAGLLLAARGALKPTGTLWLHFDDTFGAELRILCDVIFGIDNALGTLVWKRTDHHSTRNSFGRVHDTIVVYARTRVARWRLARIGNRDVVHGDPMHRIFVDGILEDRLYSSSRERVGYPTQKPVALLERFVRAGTLPGDIVLDPTCGSGTTLVAATQLGRRAIGIDISPDAIAAARLRLTQRLPIQGDLFGEAI
jgi:site-specific DNA-methyltransferase (adenine-specific)